MPSTPKRSSSIGPKGLSAGQIGERLGCSRHAVQAKLVRLGLYRRRYRGRKPLIVALPDRHALPSYELNRVVAVRRLAKPPPVNFTKAELHAMLADAVRNTGENTEKAATPHAPASRRLGNPSREEIG